MPSKLEAGSSWPRAVVRPLSVTALVVALGPMTGCAETVRGLESSMEPTIRPGELVDLDPSAYEDAEPEIGDLISVLGPKDYDVGRCGAPRAPTEPCARPNSELSDDGLLKRVVGLPGDRIAISPDGTVIRNDRRAFESYLIHCLPRDRCALPDAIVVPRGHYFVLGDNRPVSGDSRHWGPVPLDAIEGKVTPLRDARGG